jgi:hypothetical protein
MSILSMMTCPMLHSKLPCAHHEASFYGHGMRHSQLGKQAKSSIIRSGVPIGFTRSHMRPVRNGVQ